MIFFFRMQNERESVKQFQNLMNYHKGENVKNIYILYIFYRGYIFCKILFWGGVWKKKNVGGGKQKMAVGEKNLWCGGKKLKRRTKGKGKKEKNGLTTLLQGLKVFKVIISDELKQDNGIRIFYTGNTGLNFKIGAVKGLFTGVLVHQ